MKQKIERVIRNKKLLIGLAELAVVIGCIAIFCLLMIPKDRVPNRTHSYSKMEVTEYEIEDNYITRVMPITEYKTFIETATTTLNNASEDANYTLKVYKDAEKTEEVTEGYIASGMFLEAVEENEEKQDYKISVIGDITGDGDINVTELTKLIKGVVGLTGWNFTDEEKLSADISGDKEVDVVDIELCINYIVFGELDLEENKPVEPDEPVTQYTVTFKDEDGTIISTNTYEEGKTVEIPESPVKEEDERYIYEFEKWEPAVEEIVTKDAEYTAKYKAIEKEYTVVFKNYDGSEISSATYKYGEEVEVPSNPTKPEDNTYTYEFIGWDKEVTEVTGNVEYIAQYKEIYKEYIVVFKNYDDSVIITNKYHYGDTISVPANPVKPGDGTYSYEFIGWAPEITTVTGNAEYKAEYRAIEKGYTVVFKNYDGEEISSATYKYGDTVTIPETPVKPEDNTYTYEFIGWDKEVTEVKENVEYTAQFKEIYKEYTVVFKNYDDTEIITNKYHYRDTVSVPATPVKPEDNTYSYEFIGWTPEVTTVTGNVEYKAQYKETLKEYTVVFKNYDGAEISSATYKYGDTVTIPETPVKPEDNTYTYEFIGWDKEVTEVKENVEYTAQFKEIYKEYTVVFKNYDDSEIITNKYHYGDTVSVPANPVKPEDERCTYEFEKWEPQVTEVTGNVEYKAQYKETLKEYTVVFKDHDGRVISSKTYNYDAEIEIPENSERPEDNTYTYEFAGWDKEITTVKENIEYTATYISKYKKYTVVFKQDNGTILNSTDYHYGDTLIVPEEPVKEATAEYAYKFIGWTPELEETVTKNIEHTANYEKTKIEYTLIFYNDDGTTEVARIENYNYGDDIRFPATPTKEPTEEIKYVFDTWKTAGAEKITETEINIKFVAEYKEEKFTARLEATDTLEGVSYLSLEEAIENAGSEERTIRLLQDTEESAMIEDNQNITLNLNGKTITGTKNYAIKNYGILVVTDETEEKAGKIKDIVTSEIGYGIHNKEGKVTIKGGTIVTETSQESGATYGIYNQSEETLIVEGGSVIAEAKGKGAISAGIYNLLGKEIEVTGGYVLGNALGESSTGYGIYNATEGKVNVTNGRIEGKTALSSAVSYGIYNEISQEIVISEGTVAAQSDKSTAYGVYNKEGKVSITGGNIEVTAATGYGIYNEIGTIDNQAGKITMIGTTSYGIYNNSGTINVSGGRIESTGTTFYGIYNNNQMNIPGGEITANTSSSSTYGIYNNSEKDLAIQNVKITDTYYGIYNNTGKVEVTNSNIKASTGIYNNNSSAHITIDALDINAKTYGINNHYGNVIIKSANINSNQYGLYNYSVGNIEIGTKDKNISTEQPSIYGKTNAVYNQVTSTGKVKYYDGILTGKSVIYGGINEIEENSEIVVTTNEEGNEVAVLQKVQKTSVAKIGETEYTTLADAVDAVEENAQETTIIEIIEDFEISKAVEIPENKNVTIDLVGHKVKTYAKGGITNKGILEITDSSAEETGKIISNIGIGISNEGNLTLTKGAIESNGHGVYNYNDGNVVINGGTIQAKTDGIYNTVKGNITVTNGLIKGNTSIRNMGNITIKGGTLETSDYAISNSSGTMNIEGGEIEGISDANGTINISGGIIKASTVAIKASRSNINVTGGKIISDNSYGIEVALNSTVNVIGGEIQGKTAIKNAELNGGATIIIGVKDGNVNNDKPVIIGEQYGVDSNIYFSIATFKYYDGKIYGKTEAISGSITEVEEGKKVQLGTETFEEQEYKVASLIDEDVHGNGIAQIGDNVYTTVSSLKQAINEIAKNTEELVEVKILNNFEITGEIKILSGQNVRIDLNGKTITSTSAIVNNGILEITDSTELHEGKFININNDAIINSGSLTVSKGNIEGTRYGIVLKSNNVTLGTEDGEVNNETPVIKGKVNSLKQIDSSTYKAKMYDGILKGNSSSKSYVSEIEEGYKLYDYLEDGYVITAIELESPIARTGGVDYNDLKVAIDNCVNGGTVEILRSVNNIKNTITIAEGKNVTLDLKGYTITSNVDKFFVNNGIVLTYNGTIRNSHNTGVAIENNGELNLLKGTIDGYYAIKNNGILRTGDSNVSSNSGEGIAIENNGELNVAGGTISGNGYGIKNNENATVTISSGRITSNQYAIYNNSTNTINITGGTIGSSSTKYAIYNNAISDINITGGSIEAGGYSNDYVYGIYDNANGNILISTPNTVKVKGGYAYGIYNNGEGNITLEEGNISVTTDTLGYGIKNVSKGKVEITGGNINATSESGVVYGIENGTLGTVEITNGNITSNTTTGTSYGIKNMSITPLTIKQGTIIAKGKQSYGINNLTSDLIIGENDGQVSTNSPVIESDNIGIYINNIGSKFSFYDGQVIGKQSINTEANTEEGYKVIKQYSKEKQKEVATITEADNYVLTYYLNGKPYESVILKAGNEIPELKEVNEEGYEFRGWQDMPETMPAEDTNIYGMLTPKTYTITYYVDGVQYGEVETYEYKSEITPRELPVNGEREFSGWQNLPETMPAQNIEVRGVFTYTATFYNEDKTSVISTVPFTINDKRIQEPEIPTKEGYIEYWSEYEIKAEDIEIYIVYVEGNKVLNKTKEKSYDTVEEAMAEVDTDGTQNNIILRQNVTSKATITVPQGANVVIDLNGYKITNTSTYCGIDNYGTLTIEDNSEAKTGEIYVYKSNTTVYGIYNRVNVTVKSGNIIAFTSSSYSATGIYNESTSSTITLGIKDGVVSTENPKIQGTKCGINCMSGTISFYDGQVQGIRSILGLGHIDEVEYKYTTRNTTNSSTNLELCYLDLPVNGEELKAKDENGITWYYTYQDGTATDVKTYNKESIIGNINIPNNLNGYSVTSIGDYAFYYCSSLESINIPNGVTSIGDYAFYYCSSLESIEIPDSVTSIGDNAFSECAGLTSIEIPDSVTSIGDYAFSECTGLTSIEIPDSVTSIGDNAFSGCSSLTEIVIPNSVTSIGDYAFYYCSSLTKIAIPDSVTSIGAHAFSRCSSLTEIVIPNSVTSIGDTAFYGCSSLTEIVIPNSVTSIGASAFSGCTGLTSIEIPDSVTSIGSFAFNGCSSLTSAAIGNGVISIGSYAFQGCSSLSSIEIPNSVTTIEDHVFNWCSSLKDIYIDNEEENISYQHYEAFTHYIDCEHEIGKLIIQEGLEIQDVTENIVRGKISCRETYKFKVLNSEGKVVKDEKVVVSQANFYGEVSKMIMPNEQGIYSFENINRDIEITVGMLTNGKELIAIDNNGITWEYTYQDEKATNVKLYNKKSITGNIEIPTNLDGYSVTSMGFSAFSGCTGLTSIEIPDSVTSIGYAAFSGCTGLTSIEIPDSITSIGDNAFDYCSSLINIKVNINNKNYSSEEGLLYDKNKTELIRCPEGKTGKVTFLDSVTSIGDDAFSGCTGLTSIEIPDSVTSIGSYAFSGCTGLTSIEIPDSVTSIGDDAFSGCTGLTSIEIPDSVTSIGDDAFYNTAWYNNQPDGLIYLGKRLYKYKGRVPENTTIEIKEGTVSIGERAFFNSNIEEIIIPDSVTRIEKDAFLWCRSLKIVTMSKNITYIGEGAFAECISLSNIVIWKNVDEIGSRTFDKWEQDQEIDIEAGEVPEGWHEYWNFGCNAKIVYGYTGE